METTPLKMMFYQHKSTNLAENRQRFGSSVTETQRPVKRCSPTGESFPEGGAAGKTGDGAK